MDPLNLDQPVRVTTLRRDHPTWTWTAYRQSGGWIYIGDRPDGSRVVVRPFAVHCGDDRWTMQWRVLSPTTSVVYSAWDGEPLSGGPDR